MFLRFLSTSNTLFMYASPAFYELSISNTQEIFSDDATPLLLGLLPCQLFDREGNVIPLLARYIPDPTMLL